MVAVIVAPLWRVDSQAFGVHTGDETGTDRAWFSTMQNAIDHLNSNIPGESLWMLTSSSATSPSSWALIRNRESLFCMDIPNNSSANSVQVQQFGCNGTAAQRWHLSTVIGNGELQYQIRRMRITGVEFSARSCV
ncbi:MAG: RICIN domain-containing protein [Acidimicrobiia bacterium]